MTMMATIMTMIMIMIMIDSAFADDYDYCTELTQYYDYTIAIAIVSSN